MGEDVLIGSSKEGHLSSRLKEGLDQFKRPQTWVGTSNLEDKHCHMPSKHAFPFGSPFAKLQASKKWYTNITLGKDKHGKVVREKAHVLITAAMHGVPNTLFDDEVSKSKTHQALHLPKCPHVHGGCNNPLHMRWGLPRENKLDQALRRARKPRFSVGLARKPSPCKGIQVGKRVTRAQAKGT